ncbi:ER degradation-enhancing alpha-mannosidase-like protein 1 [Tanacetum coccineum]
MPRGRRNRFELAGIALSLTELPRGRGNRFELAEIALSLTELPRGRRNRFELAGIALSWTVKYLWLLFYLVAGHDNIVENRPYKFCGVVSLIEEAVQSKSALVQFPALALLQQGELKITYFILAGLCTHSITKRTCWNLIISHRSMQRVWSMMLGVQTRKALQYSVIILDEAHERSPNT